MKKFCAIFLIFLCFTLTACDPGTYVITPELLEDVMRIELVNYENSNQDHFLSWVPNHFDDLVSYDNSKETVLEELEEEQIDNFLTDFSQTHILHSYYAYNSPKDICLKLTYSNGDFLIIWGNYKNNSFAGYIGEYLADGTVESFWGSFSALSYYEDLVTDYFTTQLN